VVVAKAPRSEARLLLALASMQCVCVADFMVLSPLGPVLMRTFGIGPKEFGLLVSVHTFSAAGAYLAGTLLVRTADGRIESYGTGAWIAVAITLLSVACVETLRPAPLGPPRA
jgi:predicted MFS family arabinose efflux permease